MLNCFVHTIMYTYYMLSAFGEGVRKYLWWKKYVTMLQMVRLYDLSGLQTLCHLGEYVIGISFLCVCTDEITTVHVSSVHLRVETCMSI